jgi:hypothetical protein
MDEKICVDEKIHPSKLRNISLTMHIIMIHELSYEICAKVF